MASPHLLLVFALLLAVSWVDIRERRIPNIFLVSAVSLHLLLWASGVRWNFSSELTLLVALMFLALVLAPPLGKRLSTAIGMGDLKLILYILWTMNEAIDWTRFLIILTSISALFLLVQNGRNRSSIPFAPLLAVSTILASF